MKKEPKMPAFGIAKDQTPVFPGAEHFLREARVIVNQEKQSAQQWEMGFELYFPNGWLVKIDFGKSAGDILTETGADRAYLRPSRNAEISVRRHQPPHDMMCDLNSRSIRANVPVSQTVLCYQTVEDAIEICAYVRNLPASVNV